MKKIISIIAGSLIIIITLTGCAAKKSSNTTSIASAVNNEVQKQGNETVNTRSTDVPSTDKPKEGNSVTDSSKSAEADYSQYVKKTWVIKANYNGYPSFCITKIENGKITGRFSSSGSAVPNAYDLGQFTGTINNDIAEGQFTEKDGSKGIIKLDFKPNNIIEATIQYTNKSEAVKNVGKEGTFQFYPYNLKDIEVFKPFKDQCFTVNLNSWGNVKFVSGRLETGNHEPTICYLTNDRGDILFDFSDTFSPYSMDVIAVSFQDVNKDGLKDIIIIVDSHIGGSDNYLSTVFFQKTNGFFANDFKLDNEINSSGNNKDIKSITEFLSKKF